MGQIHLPLIIIKIVSLNFFLLFFICIKKNWWSCSYLCAGAAEPGGSGGVGPPLEFEIYLVNFLKNRKKKGFFSIGPPLGKNRSSAPVYML